MARQQLPKPWRIAVDTTADLTTLFDARMSDGDDCWVTAAGASHGKWVLDKTSALAISASVVATLSGVGRWIYFGSGSDTLSPLAYTVAFNDDCVTLNAGGGYVTVSEITTGDLLAVTFTPKGAKVYVTFLCVGDTVAAAYAAPGFASFQILKDAVLMREISDAAPARCGFTGVDGFPSCAVWSGVVACTPNVATTIAVQWKGTTSNARCRPSTDATNSISLTAIEVR